MSLWTLQSVGNWSRGQFARGAQRKLGSKLKTATSKRQHN